MIEQLLPELEGGARSPSAGAGAGAGVGRGAAATHHAGRQRAHAAAGAAPTGRKWHAAGGREKAAAFPPVKDNRPPKHTHQAPLRWHPVVTLLSLPAGLVLGMVKTFKKQEHGLFRRMRARGARAVKSKRRETRLSLQSSMVVLAATVTHVGPRPPCPSSWRRVSRPRREVLIRRLGCLGPRHVAQHGRHAPQPERRHQHYGASSSRNPASCSEVRSRIRPEPRRLLSRLLG